MNIQTPIKATPLTSDDKRPITQEERERYTSLKEHYKQMCNHYPCNRKAKAHYDWIKGVLESGEINTFGADDCIND
jgi:hypothetical protein